MLLPEQGGGRQDPRDDAHQRRAQREDRRPEARRHREDGGLRGPRVHEGAHRRGDLDRQLRGVRTRETHDDTRHVQEPRLRQRARHRGGASRQQRRAWPHVVALDRRARRAREAREVRRPHEGVPPARQHAVEPRRNRRHLQLQPRSLADARLRQLGRQFRVRERRRQTSFEHQDRGNEKRKHVVVPCAREGVPEEGMPLGRAPRARRGAWQEEGVHRHRHLPLRERIHQGDRALARKPGHHVHDVLERRA